MTFPRLHSLRRASLALCFFSLQLGAVTTWAQSDAPNELPPPPPDFVPTKPDLPRPTFTPPSDQRRSSRTTPNNPRTTAVTGSSTPSGGSRPPERVNLEELARSSAGPGIFDANSPEMMKPFDDAGIVLVELGTNDVLTLLQTLTGKAILRQQNLPAVKITFEKGSQQMNVGQMVRALESLLALNGIAITKVGEDFIKAVPAAIINTQVPILWEGSTLGAIPTQMIYEKVFKLDFLTPAEVASLIQPIMSQGAPMALDKSGIMMVTDSLVNLQRIERILETIDQPSDISTEVLFFELQNVQVQDVLQRLQQIQAGPLSRRLENNTSFDADERTNQLIVFTHPSNKTLLEELIAKMDIDVAPITSTKVYSIRYAEATEVVNIIEQVVTGQKQSRDDSNTAQNAAAARRAAQLQAQQRAANAAAAVVRAEATNLQFSDYLTLVADERANNIVASGTAADLRALDSLMEQIDVLLAQVRIEAVIVEVTLSEGDASGIDSLGFAYDRTVTSAESTTTVTDGTTSDVTTTTNPAVDTITRTLTPGALGGLSLGTGGLVWDSLGNMSLSVLASAVAKKSNAQILSAPTIVTTHNREAKISVGERRPIITGTSTSSTSDYSTSQVQYQNIGIELSVTPLIGSNGIIQLEIEQSVEDLGGYVTVDSNEQPIITSRQASSFVSVGDGQLVVLGGLQRVDSTDSESKFPILGHIPVLDKLFTRTVKSNTRREIILFIRPKIIRTAEEADQLTREQINKMENRNAVNEYLESGRMSSLTTDSEDEEESYTPPRRVYVGPGQ